jgi:hypothetical protein
MYSSAWLNVRYPASKILLLIAMPMPISCIKEMKKDEKITAVIYTLSLFLVYFKPVRSHKSRAFGIHS